MVKTILNNFKNHPTYKDYSVSLNEHDIEGSASITITKYGQNVNKFYFYPASSGNIASIAIYGAELSGHLNSIRNSMNIFGLKVDEVEMVTNSASPFVDVYLQDY
ncbi:MAG: hypothetical protein PHI48_04085 [Bacteroidales bacterium]|nr:hypothetical protein [Bacteroidales bacterium]